MIKEQVHKFYEVLWDAHDKDAIPSVLHENFTFRGSLGQEKRGHAGFSEYVDMVHKDLGDYKCKAFKKIPREIYLGEKNHSKPLPNQDNDIVFEEI